MALSDMSEEIKRDLLDDFIGCCCAAALFVVILIAWRFLGPEPAASPCSAQCTTCTHKGQVKPCNPGVIVDAEEFIE